MQVSFVGTWGSVHGDWKIPAKIMRTHTYTIWPLDCLTRLNSLNRIFRGGSAQARSPHTDIHRFRLTIREHIARSCSFAVGVYICLSSHRTFATIFCPIGRNILDRRAFVYVSTEARTHTHAHDTFVFLHVYGCLLVRMLAYAQIACLRQPFRHAYRWPSVLFQDGARKLLSTGWAPATLRLNHGS